MYQVPRYDRRKIIQKHKFHLFDCFFRKYLLEGFKGILTMFKIVVYIIHKCCFISMDVA